MIRTATADDLAAMLELSHAKRTEYEQYAPTFWRLAPDAKERQEPYFLSLLERDNTICLVCDRDDRIAGFLIAEIRNAPPVYDPGAMVCVIDDFTVERPEDWRTIGRSLLQEVRRLAEARGAGLTVVVCAHLDRSKAEALQEEGLYLASEWYVCP